MKGGWRVEVEVTCKMRPVLLLLCLSPESRGDQRGATKAIQAEPQALPHQIWALVAKTLVLFSHACIDWPTRGADLHRITAQNAQLQLVMSANYAIHVRRTPRTAVLTAILFPAPSA